MHVFLKAAAALAIAAAAVPASAATLIINASGKLTGATGVMVKDTSYDVTFETGTCAQVFSTCKTSSFAFQTQDAAVRAAAALMDQVFNETTAGKFDAVPELTAGCAGGSPIGCYMFVPYLQQDETVYSAVFSNSSRDQEDTVFGNFSRPTPNDYFGDELLARFTQNPIVSPPVVTPTPEAPVAAAVPEPATWAMMILGFGVVGGSMRRRPKPTLRTA